MGNRGMTLLEVMFSMAIFSVVMAAVYGLALSFGETYQMQAAQADANDEARRVLQRLVPDLRQAERMSINWAELPGETLRYRVALDLDGNGVAVDSSGNLETGDERVVRRDDNDSNGDTIANAQLLVERGENVTVLANTLSTDTEQPDENGVFGPDQDANGNGRLDRGIWFESWGQGLRITVQTQSQTRKGLVLRTTLQEIVYPRN